MFIYTDQDIESNRNTQKINIYPKTHQTHETTLKLLSLSKKQKEQISRPKKQRCMLIWMTLFIFYVEGHLLSVRGPFRTPNPKTSQRKWSVLKLFTFLRHFWIFSKKCSKKHLTDVPI